MSARSVTVTLSTLFLFASIAIGWGGSDPREPVTFTVEFTAGVGASVHLLGDLPELGAMEPAQSVAMVQVEEDQWEITISLPANADYRYAFYRRTAGGLGTPFSEELSGSTGLVELDPPDKTLHWLSAHGNITQLTYNDRGKLLRLDSLR